MLYFIYIFYIIKLGSFSTRGETSAIYRHIVERGGRYVLWLYNALCVWSTIFTWKIFKFFHRFSMEATLISRNGLTCSCAECSDVAFFISKLIFYGFILFSGREVETLQMSRKFLWIDYLFKRFVLKNLA